jgi:hypothetical protein
MPRREDVLSIFLASPGDVAEERARVAEVVFRWNRAWSRHLGLRLELLRWEDDSYPDIGDDAQDVINQQIPNDWDLFIGVMWARFGTPTHRAGSGTQEEYERALERHRTAPDVSLLFYFKDASIPPSKIDPAQLRLVQDFKKSVQTAGLLTWDFPDIDQFEKLFELHITKHVQQWRKTKPEYEASAVLHAPVELQTPVVSNSDTPASPASEVDDDAGYLDLLEMFSEQSSELAEISSRLTVAQQELAQQSNKGREELDRLREEPSNGSARAFRTSIAAVADEMLKFTARVEDEVPRFRTSVDASITTLTRLATLSAELYPEQVAEIRTAAFGLLQTLISARESTSGFRDSTASLPRLTKELNFSKRKQVAALNALIAEFENGERLLSEGLMIIGSLSSNASR